MMMSGQELLALWFLGLVSIGSIMHTVLHIRLSKNMAHFAPLRDNAFPKRKPLRPSFSFTRLCAMAMAKKIMGYPR